MWLCCHLWEIIADPSLPVPPPPFSSPNNHEKLHFNVRATTKEARSLGARRICRGFSFLWTKTTFNCTSFKTWSNKCILTSSFLFCSFLSNSILHSLTSHQTGMFWKEEACKIEGPWNQEGCFISLSGKNKVVEENNDSNSVCCWECTDEGKKSVTRPSQQSVWWTKVRKAKGRRQTALMEEEGASYACSVRQTIPWLWKHRLRCPGVWSELWAHAHTGWGREAPWWGPTSLLVSLLHRKGHLSPKQICLKAF